MAATTAASRKIDGLMEKASQALTETRYFEAERLAADALAAAYSAQDYERMARITLPLQEARRQRFQLAIDAADGVIQIRDEPVGEECDVESGLVLFQPPIVGADARRYRLLGLEKQIPVTTLCREPETQLGFVPIVAIAPGHTVRTRIDPPENLEHPEIEWFLEAIEAIGDYAIDSLDAELATRKRLDTLLLRLEIIPEHERLHQAVADTCRQMVIEIREEEEAKAEKQRRKAASS